MYDPTFLHLIFGADDLLEIPYRQPGNSGEQVWLDFHYHVLRLVLPEFSQVHESVDLGVKPDQILLHQNGPLLAVLRCFGEIRRLVSRKVCRPRQLVQVLDALA